MLIKTYTRPPIDNNNYLLIDEKSREAVLIDCSGNGIDDEIRTELSTQNAKIKYILLTHGHFDHVCGLRPYDDIKVFMHQNDLELLNQVNMFLPAFGIPYMTIPKIDVFVKDGDIIKLGDIDIKVLHTPGHTQGGVCYLVQDKLFSGDTIFKESVGRCDLEGGNFRQLSESIENKIFILPENIEIFPGHGSSTTVKWEKTYNRFV